MDEKHEAERWYRHAGIVEYRGDAERAERWTRRAEACERPPVESVGATWRP